jgi:hypothetical protein
MFPRKSVIFNQLTQLIDLDFINFIFRGNFSSRIRS